MAGHAEFAIAEAVRKLNSLEKDIKASHKHVQFLNADKTIDARELMQLANDLAVSAMAMEEYVLRLADDAQSMARKYPARPFKARNFAHQQAINPALASAIGYRNELRALARRIPQELDELHMAVVSLVRKAHADMGSPTRTESPPGAVVDVVGFVLSLLQLLAKSVENRRASSQRK